MTKIKYIKLVIVFLWFSLIFCMTLSIPIKEVHAYTTTYEQRHDAADPFYMNQNKIYCTSDAKISYSGTNIDYHRTHLSAGDHYAFYCGMGPVIDDDITLKIVCTSPVITIYEETFGDKFPVDLALIYINPPYTGYYNMTIEYTSVSPFTINFFGMGFLRISECQLGDINDYPWDFYSSPVNLVYVNLEEGEYEFSANSDTKSCNYFKVPDSSYCEDLDGSHDTIEDGEDGYVEIDDAGEYILYERHGYDIGIDDYELTNNNFDIMIIILIIGGLVGISVVVGVVIVKKKRSKKEIHSARPESVSTLTALLPSQPQPQAPLVMYCSICGSENKGDAVFCTRCGKKIR